MSHSKLPWTYEPQPYTQDAIWAGTKLIANVIGDSAETEANAAHIVKCVNLHDELVEALKDAHPYITSDALRSAIGDLIVKAEATNA